MRISRVRITLLILLILTGTCVKGQEVENHPIELGAIGEYWSNNVKEQKVTRANEVKARSISVKANLRIPKKDSKSALSVTFVISNRSTQTIGICNPIPSLGLILNDKKTKEQISPLAPNAWDDKSSGNKLTTVLSDNDYFYSVKDNDNMKFSEIWSLKPGSSTMLEVQMPRLVVPRSSNGIKKIPFSSVSGDYGIVTSISITLSDTPDVSFIKMFHHNFTVQ